MLKQDWIPPDRGLKKEVFKLRSINNIVIAPAKTGNLSTSKKIVTKTDHKNKLTRSILKITVRKLNIVTIKLIEPKIELIPAKWRAKITKSILEEEDPSREERGG